LSGPAAPDTLTATPTRLGADPMAKTPRMEQIEAMLADDPADAFLRYGLAMEHMSQGDDESAVTVLKELIALKADDPYVPAFLQAGQALIRLGREPEAAAVLRQGIEAARKAGDLHALGEMQGFLATIE
jgi:predicted Zn-dependent protease